MKKITILLLTLFVSDVFTQEIPLYTWRTHFAARLAKSGAIASNKVYIGCEMGMYSYDLTTDSYKVFSKDDGMAGYQVNKIAYDAASNNLIITYNDGNIDFYKDGAFTNISDFYKFDFAGSKETNHINIHNGIAFLSTNAGLLLVDIAKKEIKETYAYIGPNAALQPVLSSIIHNDSIFIASSNGVMAGGYSPAVNLQNYSRWYTFPSSSTNKTATSITVFNNNMMAIIGNRVFKRSGQSFIEAPEINVYNEFDPRIIKTYSNHIYLVYWNKIKILNPDMSFHRELNVRETAEFFGVGNKVFVVSREEGLGIEDNGGFQYKLPSSPYFNKAGRIKFYDDKVFVLPGTILPSGKASLESTGFYIFDNFTWKNVLPNTEGRPDFKTVFDIHLKNDTLYAPVFNGFLKLSYQNFQGRKYDQYNSNLTAIENNSDYYMSSTIVQDSKGDLFVGQNLRKLGDYAFFKVNPGNIFDLFYADLENSRLVRKMMVDDYDNKWIVPTKAGWTQATGGFGSSGVTVYNDKYSPKFRVLSSAAGKGKLTSNFVNWACNTKNGEVWLGTDNGVCIIDDPVRLFTSTSIPDIRLPVYDSRALLRDKIVNVITVDAANRKWIATTGDGVWLFSANGDSLLQQFNMSNSPLPSNEVYDIGINPKNGEVFFATEQGLVSYRYDATEPNGITDEVYTVKAYPNPVSPDFNGTIGMSGLGPNAVVKITDISGKLVYETRANGGTATWDGRDQSGRRVASGIYIVFSATSEGEIGIVTKIGILN